MNRYAIDDEHLATKRHRGPAHDWLMGAITCLALVFLLGTVQRLDDGSDAREAEAAARAQLMTIRQEFEDARVEATRMAYSAGMQAGREAAAFQCANRSRP